MGPSWAALRRSSLGLFGCVTLPLRSPMSRFWSSGVTARDVGYQPVGMKPLMTLLRGSSTSITATQLLSALATYRYSPSELRARASGVEPSGDLGKRAV